MFLVLDFQVVFSLLEFPPFTHFFPLNHIIDSDEGARQSRAPTLADTLGEGCVLNFNWDSPLVTMWISSILCPAAPPFFLQNASHHSSQCLSFSGIGACVICEDSSVPSDTF